MAGQIVRSVIDIAIIEVYIEFDIPSDRLIMNNEVFQQFYETVTIRSGMNIDIEYLKKRLLNIRKQGCLPRLRRFGPQKPR